MKTEVSSVSHRERGEQAGLASALSVNLVSHLHDTTASINRGVFVRFSGYTAYN